MSFGTAFQLIWNDVPTYMEWRSRLAGIMPYANEGISKTNKSNDKSLVRWFWKAWKSRLFYRTPIADNPSMVSDFLCWRCFRAPLARVRMRDIIMRSERVGIGKLTNWQVNKLTRGFTLRDNQVSVFILFPSFFLKSVLFCLSFPFFFNKIVRFSCKLSFISLPLQNKVFRLHGAR